MVHFVAVKKPEEPLDHQSSPVMVKHYPPNLNGGGSSGGSTCMEMSCITIHNKHTRQNDTAISAFMTQMFYCSHIFSLLLRGCPLLDLLCYTGKIRRSLYWKFPMGKQQMKSPCSAASLHGKDTSISVDLQSTTKMCRICTTSMFFSSPLLLLQNWNF